MIRDSFEHYWVEALHPAAVEGNKIGSRLHLVDELRTKMTDCIRQVHKSLSLVSR